MLLVENGERGVALFKEYAAEISVVVIDRMMPVMDGTKAMAAMRHIRSDANFILAAGLVQAADHDQHSGPGKVELLRKPFTTEKLLEVVRGMK